MEGRLASIIFRFQDILNFLHLQLQICPYSFPDAYFRKVINEEYSFHQSPFNGFQWRFDNVVRCRLISNWFSISGEEKGLWFFPRIARISDTASWQSGPRPHPLQRVCAKFPVINDKSCAGWMLRMIKNFLSKGPAHVKLLVIVFNVILCCFLWIC